MTQRWYKSRNIQAAIIGGIFLIFVTILGAYLNHYISNDKKSDLKQSSQNLQNLSDSTSKNNINVKSNNELKSETDDIPTEVKSHEPKNLTANLVTVILFTDEEMKAPIILVNGKPAIVIDSHGNPKAVKVKPDTMHTFTILTESDSCISNTLIEKENQKVNFDCFKRKGER